jgi:hypothetical protein
MHKSQFSILLSPSCFNHNGIFNLFLAFSNFCSLHFFNCFYLAQCIRDSKFGHQWILWQSFHHPPQSKILLLILGEWARKMGCACMMVLHQLSSHAKVRLISKNIMLTYMAISFCKMLPFVLFSSQDTSWISHGEKWIGAGVYTWQSPSTSPLPYTNPHGFAPVLGFGYMENASRVATPNVISNIVRLWNQTISDLKRTNYLIKLDWRCIGW